MFLITKDSGAQFLTRLTFSNYPNLGPRLNYFTFSVNIILTKQKNCSRISTVMSNSYSLGVF